MIIETYQHSSVKLKSSKIKNAIKSATLLSILALTTSTVTAQTASNVKWFANPDDNITTHFRRFDEGSSPKCDTGPNAVRGSVDDPDDQYGKVWQIKKFEDRQRAEFARARINGVDFKHNSGETYYYGWRFRVNDAGSINKDVTVWQWKTRDTANPKNTQNYPLNMEYDGSKLIFNAFGPNKDATGKYINTNVKKSDGSIYSGVSDRKTTLWEGELPEDKWVRIVVKIKADPSVTKGEVSLWINGRNQTLKNTGDNYTVRLSDNKLTAFHRTIDGSDTSTEPRNYAKWGAYNGNSCPWEIETLFDEMRISTTRADAEPRTWDR